MRKFKGVMNFVIEKLKHQPMTPIGRLFMEKKKFCFEVFFLFLEIMGFEESDELPITLILFKDKIKQETKTIFI